MKYDCLLIDAVNLAHKTFKHKDEIPVNVSKKPVYKESVCNFIRSVEDLRKKYLHFDGQVYLLFDNYFSRADLQSSFMYADRKELSEAYKKTRKKENKEFYNSINLLRYYYLIGHPEYHTCRIEGLEADDLVRPLLQTLCKDKNCLMVTNDLDWCRYLSKTNHWLPKLDEEPEDSDQLELKMGFPINEKNIICFKSFFGDASDNIPSLGRSSKEIREDFLKLLPEVNYPEDMIMMSRGITPSANVNKALRIINENERQFIINLQLVSTLPCAPEYVVSSCTTGRNDETLRKTIREVLGVDIVKNKFKFGNLKRPRI